MSKNLERFKQTYEWHNRLSKIDPKTDGLWEIRGEDPNCELHGPHHQPYLGTYSGTFEDVVAMAVEMAQFWQWGYGGTIRAVDIKVANKAAPNQVDIAKRLIEHGYESSAVREEAALEIRKLRAAIEKMRCAGCKYEFQAAFDEAKMLIPSNHETERTTK